MNEVEEGSEVDELKYWWWTRKVKVEDDEDGEADEVNHPAKEEEEEDDEDIKGEGEEGEEDEEDIKGEGEEEDIEEEGYDVAEEGVREERNVLVGVSVKNKEKEEEVDDGVEQHKVNEIDWDDGQVDNDRDKEEKVEE